MFCHFQCRIGSRKTGQSGAAKHDYISRQGKYRRCGGGDDLILTESGNMPEWAADDPGTYWEAADDFERANGRLFRSITTALPNTLDRHQKIELARAFAKEVCGPDLPYSLALHEGRNAEDAAKDNPHLHLVFSERVNDGISRSAETWFRRAAAKGRNPETGGARKTRATMPKEWMTDTRAAWARLGTEALRRAGIDDEIDPRSLDEQRKAAEARGDHDAALALNRAPTIHRGPVVTHRPNRAPDRAAAVRKRDESIQAIDDEERRARETVERFDALTRELDRAYAEAVAATPPAARERRAEPLAPPPSRADDPRLSAAALSAEKAARAPRAPAPEPAADALPEIPGAAAAAPPRPLRFRTAPTPAGTRPRDEAGQPAGPPQAPPAAAPAAGAKHITFKLAPGPRRGRDDGPVPRDSGGQPMLPRLPEPDGPDVRGTGTLQFNIVRGGGAAVPRDDQGQPIRPAETQRSAAPAGPPAPPARRPDPEAGRDVYDDIEESAAAERLRAENERRARAEARRMLERVVNDNVFGEWTKRAGRAVAEAAPRSLPWGQAASQFIQSFNTDRYREAADGLPVGRSRRRVEGAVLAEAIGRAADGVARPGDAGRGGLAAAVRKVLSNVKVLADDLIRAVVPGVLRHHGLKPTPAPSPRPAPPGPPPELHEADLIDRGAVAAEYRNRETGRQR